MQPIAIVGISGLFPGARNTQEFWRHIIAKQDLITDIPAQHWLIEDYYAKDPHLADKTYSKRGGFIPPCDFDPLFFGIPPKTLAVIDSSQLLSLIAAKQVLDDAGVNLGKAIDLTRTSIILGVTGGQSQLEYTSSRLQRPIWQKVLAEHNIEPQKAAAICTRIAEHYTPFEENTLPGTLGSIVAGRIANRFNLGGTNCTTDAACASTLSAINMAVQELLLNKADTVITGGVDTVCNIGMYVLFCKTTALSLTDDCRPFDQHADGTLLAEGIGFFVLKRLADAEKAGDKIYAVIKGIGSSSDGRAKSIYAPVAAGQIKAIQQAYVTAGYAPSEVELIEAHGTGTPTGDIVEFAALTAAFTNAGDQRIQQCAIGSVKSQIGHTKAAAGAASLCKVIYGLVHKILPATIKVTQPNPEFKITQSPFYINANTRPWIHEVATPRRAAVSSFGFGGTNYHLTLEEYQKTPTYKIPFWPTHLLFFSAENVHELITNCKQALTIADEHNLIFFSQQSQISYQKNHNTRVALVVNDIPDLKNKLKCILDHLQQDPSQQSISSNGYYAASPLMEKKIALLFPGYGSQYLNMGMDLTLAFNYVRKVWDEFNQQITVTEKKLHDIVFPIAAFDEATKQAQLHQLTLKEYSLPAICITQLAMQSLFNQFEIKPKYYAGYDVGLLTATYLAGKISRDELLQKLNNKTELASANLNLSGAQVVGADSSIFDLHDFQHSIDEIYATGTRIFINMGPTAQLSLRIKQQLYGKSVHVINLDEPQQHGITQLWHMLAELFVLGINPNMNSLWAEYHVVPNKPNHNHYAVQITGTTYSKPYPLKETDQKTAVINSSIENTASHHSPTFATRNEEQKMNVLNNDINLLSNLTTESAKPDNAKDWLQLLSIMQKQIAESHKGFQAALTEGYLAYLHTSENMLLQFSNLSKIKAERPEKIATYVNSNNITENIIDLESAKANANVHITNPPNSRRTVADVPRLDRMVSTQDAENVAYNQEINTSNDAKLELVKPVHAVNSNPNAIVEITNLLLAIIADKTGYPTEMLSLSMSLEADLGIDSIKRVEILSALQENLNASADIDQTKLAAMQTINDIVNVIAEVQNADDTTKKK